MLPIPAYPMDRLTVLLNRFSLSAGVFYAGSICGIRQFSAHTQLGHVHLVRKGPIEIGGATMGSILITEPTLVFMPRPEAHRLVAHEREGADLVCATFRFGRGGSNPVTDSMPGLVLVPLADLPASGALLELLYDEAFSEHCGRQAALDRVCELLIIRLLRHCMDRGLTQGGTLAGLADPRLAKALLAIHEDPRRPWDLSEMAHTAGMSRARFAVRFREVIRETPADYLASWRIVLAQALLRAGRPLKHVAFEVGYGSSSALSRAFLRKTGHAPSQWLRWCEQGEPRHGHAGEPSI